MRAAVRCLSFALVLASAPAAAFDVRGAVVDIAPLANGGEIDLTTAVAALARARQADDPAGGLVFALAGLPSDDHRRAAFAWLVTTAADPAQEAASAFRALLLTAPDDGRLALRAAVFAQSKGARARSLYRAALAADAPPKTTAALARLAGVDRTPAPWRATSLTAPAPAAASGG